MLLDSRANCVMSKVRKLTSLRLKLPGRAKEHGTFGWVVSYALYRGYVNSKDMVVFHAGLDSVVALNLGQMPDSIVGECSMLTRLCHRHVL